MATLEVLPLRIALSAIRTAKDLLVAEPIPVGTRTARGCAFAAS